MPATALAAVPNTHARIGAPSRDRAALDVATLAEAEARYIRYVFEVCERNQARTARVLGIGRSTLRRKLGQR